MCTIKGKSYLREFTGYKVVVTDKHGHHYSPYTGIRYQPGPVPKLKRIGKYAAYPTAKCYMIKYHWSYDKFQSENNLTAVHNKLDDAKYHLNHDFISGVFRCNSPKNCKYNIVEMTISGELYDGTYVGQCTLGNVIKSIKLIK